MLNVLCAALRYVIPLAILGYLMRILGENWRLVCNYPVESFFGQFLRVEAPFSQKISEETQGFKWSLPANPSLRFAGLGIKRGCKANRIDIFFYNFTAILLKSGAHADRALFSKISLSTSLPVKPILGRKSNNTPLKFCHIFEIFHHVWVSFIVGRFLP